MFEADIEKELPTTIILKSPPNGTESITSDALK
jgi:hypothetical protein